VETSQGKRFREEGRRIMRRSKSKSVIEGIKGERFTNRKESTIKLLSKFNPAIEETKLGNTLKRRRRRKTRRKRR